MFAYVLLDSFTCRGQKVECILRCWYFLFLFITIAVVVAALMFGNVLFALLLLLSGFALAIIGAKKPSVVPFAVTVRGVRVGDELYPLSTLKSYHIDEEDPRGPQLIILTKKHFLPLLVMPIPTDYIDDIDDILQGKIKEELLNEPLFMRALERFGF